MNSSSQSTTVFFFVKFLDPRKPPDLLWYPSNDGNSKIDKYFLPYFFACL